MKHFNWQLSSIEELAQHINTLPKPTVRQQINYYKLLSADVMLKRIEQAQMYVALWKAEKEVLLLKKLLVLND